MSVQMPQRDRIVLDGVCPSEDAETLLQRLLASPSAVVDLRSCQGLHTAVIQVLLAAEPTLHMPPPDGEIARRLLSQLRSIINI
jgi:hypothetical protein